MAGADGTGRGGAYLDAMGEVVDERQFAEHAAALTWASEAWKEMTRYSGWSSWDPRVTGAGLVRCWADERRERVTERLPRVSTHHRCDPR